MKKLQGNRVIETFVKSATWAIPVFAFLAWYPKKFIDVPHLIVPNDVGALILMYGYWIILGFSVMILAHIFDAGIKDFDEIKGYLVTKHWFWLLSGIGHILGFFAWKIFWPGGLY